MKNKKKLFTSIMAILCVVALLVGSLAFFTDRLVSRVSENASTLDIQLEQNWVADNAAVAESFRPGQALILNYTLKNVGGLAADVREKVAISTNGPLTEATPEFVIYNAADVTVDAAGTATIADGAVPLTSTFGQYADAETGDTWYKLTYDLTPFELNGSAETATGIDTKEKAGALALVFNLGASNEFSNVGLRFEYMAQAIQWGHPGNATWEDATVVSDSVMFGGVDEDVVPGPDMEIPGLIIDQKLGSSTTSPLIVENGSFVLSGTVTDKSGVKSLMVNGSEVAVNDDSTWSTTMSLTPGEVTEITVVAFDNKDNMVTKVGYVLYKLGPGLYQTGSNYTVLLKSWEKLIKDGAINVANNRITSTTPNQLAGDLWVSDTIVSIDRLAFGTTVGYNTYLTGVLLPDSVTSIGEKAFYNCKSLKSITIPEGVTRILSETFYQCTSLKSVTLPDSLTSIADYAFSDCSSLTSITIPDGVTSIGRAAFQYCSSLTSVTIPDGVTSIGSDIFSRCKKLTSIKFNGSMERWSVFTNNAYRWNYYCSEITVTCTDGTVTVPAYGS